MLIISSFTVTLTISPECALLTLFSIMPQVDARFHTILLDSTASTLLGRETFERGILSPDYKAGTLRRYRLGLLGVCANGKQGI